MYDEEFSVRTRTLFSIAHIQSAAIFARRAAAIEESYEGTYSEDLHSEHRASATASLFLTVAFLESNINEIFADAAEPNGGILQPLGPTVVQKFAQSWAAGVPRTAKYAVVEKYQIALDLAAKPVLNKGARPLQDIQLLVKLRNALIHYEPEWVHAELYRPLTRQEQHEFSQKLRGRFPINRLTGGGNPFYPDKVLGAGCAKWAVEYGIRFSDAFYRQLGVPPRYEHVRHRLVLQS